MISLNEFVQLIDLGPNSNQDTGSLPPKLPKMLVEYGDSKSFNVRKGLSKQEEAQLLQLVLDCGGILKTLISTHDINIEKNVFLQNLFSLSHKFKTECHDISKVLVNLSSKIKSVH